MVHYTASYKFGKEKEQEILPIIKAFFKREIKAYPNQYDDFDFWDGETEYELKSRTNSYSQYPTTMITRNKISKPNSKQIILLFNYTDGLYFIKYNEEQFSKYETKFFSRAKQEWDEKEHIYIPIVDLKKVSLE